MDKSCAGIYEIDSVTSEERANGGEAFVTLESEHPSDGDGNFSVLKMFFTPPTALAVGKALILHAKRCGATDPETKE